MANYGYDIILDDGVGTPLKNYAYCLRNSLDEREPNGYGIYDINGWHHDMAHDNAGCDFPNTFTNPICEDSTQEAHVHVGGWSNNYAWQIVNGKYGTATPTCYDFYYSFRLARTITTD